MADRAIVTMSFGGNPDVLAIDRVVCLLLNAPINIHSKVSNGQESTPIEIRPL